ncbi:MAG: glycoside hydrolase family 3 N-terminal domain-containing protein [Candidatus Korobacteraceae bacterium]
MTLEEKAGQMTQFSIGTPTGPGTGLSDYKEMVARGEVGAILNMTGAAQTNAMQKIAVEQSRLHIPLIFGLDIIHGYRTSFPIPLGLSATWNPELIERVARLAAQEGSRAGIRWTFSPMVDIARDARWGRIAEGAGEDPYLGSAIAAAYVRGYQGASLSNPDSLAACAKHFAGYGAVEGGRDYNTAEIPERLLRQIYLPPFEAAADAGAATFMSAFEALNEVPSTENAFTLKTVLRDEWNFKGLVVSDYDAVAELIPQGVALDGATAARKAAIAGVDMDMESNLYRTELPALVRSGAVPQAVLDEAVRRILRVKFALGLFDHPYTAENDDAAKPIPPASLELARTTAEQSFVLLKNAPVNGKPILPLDATVKTIAVIGPLADDGAQMVGSWGGKSTAKDVTTLRAALEARLQSSGGRVLYAKGADLTGSSDAGFAEAVNAAKKSDVVIMALGEDANLMTGEAASRAHLDLPGNQEQLLEAVTATGKPIVLLVFSGRPLVLNWAAQHVAAIMEAWFPGVQAGPALVRTLYGDVSPSGKLTTSFPRAVGQEPLYYNALNTGRPANKIDLTHPPTNNEEKYVSRYVDEQNSPLFPFGFGLSYTTFDYSPATLSASSASATALNQGSESIRISAEVKNTGDREADEIVQLYIRQRGTSVARPVRELKGFRRITLAPGQSQRVEFTLGRDELSFWNINMKDVVEPAQVTVWIAPDSTRGTPAQFTIH